MKSDKYIKWGKYFCLGAIIKTAGGADIVLSERFNIAPKLIDKGIHKANRLWRYYTFKQLPGAVIFLGAK